MCNKCIYTECNNIVAFSSVLVEADLHTPNSLSVSTPLSIKMSAKSQESHRAGSLAQSTVGPGAGVGVEVDQESR